MAWGVEEKKVCIKMLGTVESSLKYDAINYNDPITVGMMQWYGPRAAAILNRMRTENPGSWTGVASSINRDLVNGLRDWAGRHLSSNEGSSLKPVLRNNKIIQNQQSLLDLGDYEESAKRQGIDIEGNTNGFMFFCCMYHQSPRQALRVIASVGPSASIDRMRAGANNNSVLTKYDNRYDTAVRMIKTRDSSGIDLGVGVSDNDGTPDTDNDEIGDGPTDTPNNNFENAAVQPTTPIRVVQRVGSTLVIRQRTGASVTAYPSTTGQFWVAGGDSSIGAPVPAPVPVPDDPYVPPPPPPDPVPSENPGTKALAWMIKHSEKWAYLQGAGRLNPFRSGYTDCSGATYLAYLQTSNIKIGEYTTPQSSFGRLITTDREQIRRGEGLLPGDLIFYRNYVRKGWPYNHVEMYTGDSQRRTIGQVGSTAPGPSFHPMDRYLNYGKLAVMARRPW